MIKKVNPKVYPFVPGESYKKTVEDDFVISPTARLKVVELIKDVQLSIIHRPYKKSDWFKKMETFISLDSLPFFFVTSLTRTMSEYFNFSCSH